MARSAWKGLYTNIKLFQFGTSIHAKKLDPSLRKYAIPEYLIGQEVEIYNGKELKKVKVTRERVGYKFGLFCTTRRFNISDKVLAKSKKVPPKAKGSK